MPFYPTPFHGLWIFEPQVFEDERGIFFEAYNHKVFLDHGIDVTWIQDNQSVSKYGVIRGLHYQLPPHAQAKLIRVVSGEIFDVALDLRKGSPTFGKYFGMVLSADNRKQLFIPKGFAHGFSVLSPQAIVLYKCDALYNRDSEAGVHYSDPALNIDWKLPHNVHIVSEKDKQLPPLASCKNTFLFDAS
ncbi:MAG: dTDP-4-dehydrorhamnose 3,5-epimerase [Chitinophagaceae bacterium]|nr:dTDP-4-dehydrorhamnose 3,5-epimerase [Chitinophagaceae bacterium]